MAIGIVSKGKNMEDEEPRSVPVPRAGLLEEYQQYVNAVDAHNRKAMASACGSPQWYIDEVISPARQAPRCEHIRAEGLRCQAPALRGRKLCYAHTRMLASQKAGLQLPPLEDASGIALASMQVVQQMLNGKLARKTAAVALYGIQIVASTLRYKPFSPKPTSVVLEAAGLPPEEELLARANLVSQAEQTANGEQTSGQPEVVRAGTNGSAAVVPGASPASEHGFSAQRTGEAGRGDWWGSTGPNHGVRGAPAMAATAGT
jgi:hypothetical protein